MERTSRSDSGERRLSCSLKPYHAKPSGLQPQPARPAGKKGGCPALRKR